MVSTPTDSSCPDISTWFSLSVSTWTSEAASPRRRVDFLGGITDFAFLGLPLVIIVTKSQNMWSSPQDWLYAVLPMTFRGLSTTLDEADLIRFYSAIFHIQYLGTNLRWGGGVGRSCTWSLARIMSSCSKSSRLRSIFFKRCSSIETDKHRRS